MTKKWGFFSCLGHLGWFLIWIALTFSMVYSVTSEKVFILKEAILILLIWSTPIISIIILNSKNWGSVIKNSYFFLYIVFSIALFNDEVLSQNSKLWNWVIISAPIFIIAFKFFQRERKRSEEENQEKQIEIERKKHLNNEAIQSKKIQEVIKLKRILAEDKAEIKEKLDEIERSIFETEFIKNLKKIYNEGDYSYSKLKYINPNNKVLVTCKSHGDFSIKPRNLAAGAGCPKCSLLNYSNPKSSNLVSENKVIQSNTEKEVYSNELESKDLNNKDLLKLIYAKLGDLTKGQRSIKSDTSEILTNTNLMMSEIQDIKSSTKNTNESIEKSILKIIKSVDKAHDFNKIDDYIPKVTEWFKFWDKIEKNTKTFMPGSEWLYDNIKISEFQDFSPFVLYYCRALENELLKKIFLSFHDHVNKMSDEKFKLLFIWGKNGLNEKKIKEYHIFFNQFKTNILQNREKYTLGDMRLILNLLPNSKNKKGSTRFRISPLLKELNKFISNKIGGIDSETIKRLEDLIINYRNKSAHVDIIDEEKAMIFYKEFKIIMNKLIGKF